MAGVAQGDRIRSQDVTPLMRRINALEAHTFVRGSRSNAQLVTVDSSNSVHTQMVTGGLVNKYTSVGKLVRVYPVNELLAGWGGSGHIYSAEGGAGSDTLHRYTAEGVFVGSSSFPTEIEGLNLHPSIALDGKVYGASENQPADPFEGEFTLHQLNATGTELNSETITPNTGGDVIIFGMATNKSNGDVYAMESSSSIVYKFDNGLNLDDEWVTEVGIGDGDGFAAATNGKTAILNVVATQRIYVFESNGDADTDWEHGAQEARQLAIDSSNNLVAARDNVGGQEIVVYSGMTSTETRTWDIYAYTVYAPGQTTFFKYPTSDLLDKVSLGTPDEGVSIPALTALELVTQRGNELTDMHDAIEALLVNWKNAVTGNAFNWTNLSEDNLYNVAVELGVYGWKETGGRGVLTREDYIDEVDLCLAKLEASVPF